MYVDVGITLGARGGMEVQIRRRSRKTFRSRIAQELGAVWGGSESLAKGMSPDDLDRLKAILAEEYPDWNVGVFDERPVQLRPGDKVLWAEEVSRYGGSSVNGYVGEVRLFWVSSWYTRKNGHAYALNTSLPGYNNGPQGCTTKPFSSQEEAQVFAEGLLVRFLAKLGAELKED